MHDVRAHLARSERNESIATSIAPTSPEWECVVWFYSAVHLVQAYLLTKDARFAADNHSAREKAINASTELTKGGRFVPAYRKLRNLADQARYDPHYQARPADQQGARDSAQVIKSFVRSKIDRALASGSTGGESPA